MLLYYLFKIYKFIKIIFKVIIKLIVLNIDY